MTHLLDTDHISILQKAASAEFAAIASHASRHPIRDVVTCQISFHEQTLGAHAALARAKDVGGILFGYELLATILDYYSKAVVVSFDATAAKERDALMRAKVRIPAMDLRIAAVALANGLTLVTRNARDFSKVPGLTIVDWTK